MSRNETATKEDISNLFNDFITAIDDLGVIYKGTRVSFDADETVSVNNDPSGKSRLSGTSISAMPPTED